MNTPILAVVLAGAALAGQNAPAWQPNYAQAQQMGRSQNKPLAIVFGYGADGWMQVVDGNASPELRKLLTDKYVCVYADTATPAGKKLAQDFALTGRVGLVLSDAAGSTQAFWHQGSLPSQSLTPYLQKYADPRTVVQSTETFSATRTSYYPPSTVESLGGLTTPADASYCPNCQNVRGRR